MYHIRNIGCMRSDGVRVIHQVFRRYSEHFLMINIYQFFYKDAGTIGDVKICKYPKRMNGLGLLRYEIILICIY
jgi:hypothetical protein